MQRSRQDTRWEAAVAAIGEEEHKKHRELWNSIDSGYGKPQYKEGNGLILCLLSLGLTSHEVRGVLGSVGDNRIHKLQKFDMENPPTHANSGRKPKHAFTNEELQAIKDDAMTWEVEDGFPCAHRQPMQYIATPGATWKSLHELYTQKIKGIPDILPAKYHRWTQYIHLWFPNLRLSRTQEDMCSCCERIRIALMDPELTDEMKSDLIRNKETHLDEARTQRALMNTIVKDYCRQHEDASFVQSLNCLLLQLDKESVEENEEEEKKSVMMMELSRLCTRCSFSVKISVKEFLALLQA
eukprot:IDg5512t1